MNCCPPLTQLRHLLAEQLQAPEAQAVEAHVETCATCQRALEELTGEIPFAGHPGPATPEERLRVQAVAPLPAPPLEDLCEDCLRRLENEPAAGPVTPPGPASCTETQEEMSLADVAVLSQPQGQPRYTLTRLHAKGGIGEVWVARDADLGRE